ncbi:target of rapamycin complex 2 subunit MAPKAP1 isoform X2 [Enhydra lutris kenyoni]|uniref:Target of rapamycin complex 2 subunit MAPKAP1 n=1 Tax=Enhydra lutris kenyoni TaxID=391180 RepID=A0A2Y9JFK5_ENHLU|nr:target of rapamycin complex 2 subunit MAPKAP1 isoform X2 [Enhydra lutris kenyoni]
MAFLDNPTIILAHIRQSHVTSDDTGMCEMVLIDHDVDLEKIHPPSMPGDSGSEIQGSNAQRLERLRKERQNQIKCKNIQWKERNSKQSAQELKSLFEKKSLKEKPPSSGKQSILSVRLEQCPLQLNNPFNEYSKFDGKGHVGTTATKKIDVYLPLHSSQDRLLPMTVVTMASARVQDLIGLICWQYTSEGREPKLNDNVSAYCLHIAEDDGEVDTDFPPLDSNEPIHKFGFSTLALVEKYSSPGLTSKESLFVRINAAHGFSLIQVDNTKVTMKEILLKAVKRRKGSQKISASAQSSTDLHQPRPSPGNPELGLYSDSPICGDIWSQLEVELQVSSGGRGPQYRLEKQSEPNVAVDLESTLESQSAWEFCLVRENSSRADGVFEEDSQIDIATVQDMLSSHHYKSFKVSMIHRLRFTTDVQLGISGDKVEIDPVTNQKASTKFWIKQKPISIDSDLLCACDLAEEKSPSHAIFKVTYLSNHDYKHLYFESDAATVNEIVLKVNYILESRASTARADYFAQKQRKLNRRTSFSFQKEKKSGQQ